MPPEAAIAAWYLRPAVPRGSAAVVIFSGGFVVPAALAAGACLPPALRANRANVYLVAGASPLTVNEVTDLAVLATRVPPVNPGALLPLARRMTTPVNTFPDGFVHCSVRLVVVAAITPAAVTGLGATAVRLPAGAAVAPDATTGAAASAAPARTTQATVSASRLIIHPPQFRATQASRASPAAHQRV